MRVDLESIADATSGAIGALVSTTILYPLDTCKTKYQAEVRARHQLKYRKTSDVFWEAVSNGQVLSLYQGLGTKNLQSFVSSFIYFYGYSFFKRLYLRKSGNKSIGAKANLIAAAAAGACTVIVTQPLDTAASRMQTSSFGRSRGLLETLSEGTWSEAFDGLGISLLLTSNPAIQQEYDSLLSYRRKNLVDDEPLPSYTVFDQLKQRLVQQQQLSNSTDSPPKSLFAFSAFLLGALSKCIATSITYPAIRCKVMLQAAESDENGIDEIHTQANKSISTAVLAIWKREGLFGFFKGLKAQILKTVLSASLLLMIKEKLTKSTWVLLLAVQRFLFVTRAKIKNT